MTSSRFLPWKSYSSYCSTWWEHSEALEKFPQYALQPSVPLLLKKKPFINLKVMKTFLKKHTLFLSFFLSLYSKLDFFQWNLMSVALLERPATSPCQRRRRVVVSWCVAWPATRTLAGTRESSDLSRSLRGGGPLCRFTNKCAVLTLMWSWATDLPS